MDTDEINIVMVDEDGPVVTVYDSRGEMEPIEFWREDYPSRHVQRNEAEYAARREAERLGCEWGTNY